MDNLRNGTRASPVAGSSAMLGLVFQLPDHLDTEALHSTAPVYPAFLDRLRTVAQKKLNWDPFMARQFFIAYMPAAKAGALTAGVLVTAVVEAHGSEAALAVARALAWFGSEAQIKREHRRAFKRRA